MIELPGGMSLGDIVRSSMESGRLAERAAIVAWLLRADNIRELYETAQHYSYEDFAADVGVMCQAIEAGEHAKEDV